MSRRHRWHLLLAESSSPTSEKLPIGIRLRLAEEGAHGTILDVESEPVESSLSLLDGFPSSNDETESQIFAKAYTWLHRPNRIAGRLRDVVSIADRSTPSEFAGKRFVRAVPLPESTVRLSIG